jgi:hypothetical protein
MIYKDKLSKSVNVAKVSLLITGTTESLHNWLGVLLLEVGSLFLWYWVPNYIKHYSIIIYQDNLSYIPCLVLPPM